MCVVEEQKQALVPQIFDLFSEKSSDKTSKITFYYHVG